MDIGKFIRTHRIPRREERKNNTPVPSRAPIPRSIPRRRDDDEGAPIYVPNWPVRKPERVKRDER